MKVVFISSMTPSGHYSQYITYGLNRQKNIDLIVYAGLHEKGRVDQKKYGQVKYVWHKGASYIRDILNELKKDRPDVVHIQQEFNMYGGTLTGAILPLLILLLRLNGFKTVVTIHAAVYKKQIDDEFIHLFHKNSKVMRPFILKSFFHYVFKISSVFANRVFIHTYRKLDILTHDYGVSKKKIDVVPIVIPSGKIKRYKKEPYFFYFGYMVRRKGLEYALEGFKKFVKKHPKTPYKLVMAGGVIKGQEKAFDEIKDFIKESGLSKKVEIKGFIEERDQDALYGRAYAVIIPARVSMGSSGPLFHAMSYGKCVIASREGYFLEDIKNLKSGILTENNKWDRAFEYAVSHKSVVSSVEKNIEKRAQAQSPDACARIYATHYESLFK